MKRHWKAATPAEVDEIERQHRAWIDDESSMEPPDMSTWRVMALVERIRQLERQCNRIREATRKKRTPK